MTIKYLVDNGEISQYYGILPDHLSLDRFGLDWCIFESESEEDAWKQASSFECGKHPHQERISQLASSIRSAYNDDDNVALEMLQKEFPSDPLPVIVKLEAIGDDCRQFYNDLTGTFVGNALFGNERNPFRRPWVAEITGLDQKYKFKREFLRGRKDYSEANKKGSRGVYYYYELDPGKIYQINDLVSWKKTYRYFATVINGEVIEISEERVKECLRENLE